ncbi:DUF2732 family protein [Proteus mirabilis]
MSEKSDSSTIIKITHQRFLNEISKVKNEDNSINIVNNIDLMTDLIKAVREDERKSRAVFYTVRLHSLISKITSEQMERPEIVQLVEGEIENIEHQAQEWNYV